jgi:hypothetical protein
MAEDPVSLGYVVGTRHGANSIIRLFTTHDGTAPEADNVWLRFKTKKQARHLISQIAMKHPSVAFMDET